MLVLTRELGDAFIIGNDSIIVSILGVDEDKVKIGFTSGREDLILRDELIIPHIKALTAEEKKKYEER